jgi:hypothetical protein
MLVDLFHVVCVSKAMIMAERVLTDHDPVKYVLVLDGENMRDFPDGVAVGAKDGDTTAKYSVGDRLLRVARSVARL